MKSSTKLIIVATAVLLAALLVNPAAARGNASVATIGWGTVKHINAGDVMFEYEQGLNLTGLGGSGASSSVITALRKYADDDPVGGALLNDIPVADMRNFDVLPSAVAGQYGIYYPVIGGQVVKNATQIRTPAVTLGVVLATSTVDSVDGKSLTRDNQIAFKISAPYLAAYYVNNSYLQGVQGGLVYPLSGSGTERYPLAVRIEVTTPGGGKVNALNGVVLNPIYINGTEFFTNAVTSLGVPIPLTGIEAGTYTAVAKWVNTANLTSGFVERAPNSNAVTFTVLSKPLTITTNKETVTRGNTFTVTVTGESKRSYYVYLRTTSLGAGKTYPLIAADQVGINRTAGTVTDRVQSGQPSMNQYHATYNVTDATCSPGSTCVAFTSANLTTSADGTRGLLFETAATTDDRKFTVKVVDPDDLSKYDQVDVSVEKGKVTITYEGTGSYYLGETIKLTGTNTDSKNVYLFLTGPNLATNGVSLADIRVQCVDGYPPSYKVVDVNTDNTWSFKWDTSTLTQSLDAGTYTLYAAAAPQKKDNLTATTYETASVVLKKPFITASVSTNTLAKGDKLFIRGTAEGKPNNVYVWIFGKNYRLLFQSASVRSDATYEYKLDRGATSTLYAGQYFAVVQHPMMNGVPDIVATASNDGATGNQSRTWPFGAPTVVLAGLQASDAATALVDLMNSANIDDTYTKLSFMLEEPWIRIDTIGDKYVGDTFKITGTTNLAEGDSILMSVVSSSFKPTEKTQTGEFSGSSGTVTVQKGDTYNTFSFDVDASTFKPDEYLVKAESIEPSQTATATFNVLEGQPTTVATPERTPILTLPPTTVATPPPTTAVPTTTAKPQPGFGALVALVGLGAVALLVLRRH